MKRMLALAAPLVLLGLMAAEPALAADHEVKMLNRGAAGNMVFEPAYLRIELGDTVTFVPTDKSHNAESIPGMAPTGGASFKGAMNKPIVVTFEAEGVYGYRCAPHYGMGMVGIVQVGNAAPNIDAARAVKHPGQANQVMSGLLTRTADKTAAK